MSEGVFIHKILERSSNRVSTASIPDAIPLNTSTDVQIAAANDDRIYLCVFAADADMWLKLCGGGDNIKKGILLREGEKWQMPTDNIYTGAICAIAENDSPNAYITEY
jgi:hypothetical protein